ncbi:MAG: type VII secretion protein EccB [Mycobacteriaceae bacterium]|nr:type VII secretion protein EccB [Mycobacteriaceae bacterium]
MSPDHRADPRPSGRGLGLSTRVQVSGHLFLARRAALALTRRRVRMEYEPGRRQTMAVIASITVAAVICIGALLWSFLKPAASLGDSPIIQDSESGALYVKVGNTLYPALNLASTRLISGRPDNPTKVRSTEISAQPHGALVGIPGAPSQLSTTTPQTSSWAVCDTVTAAVGPGAPEPVTVTVIDGAPTLGDRHHVLGDADAVVLKYGDDSWVIRGGRRSRIDPAARSVLLALGLTPEQVSGARPMSRALFEALPVGPELAVPTVPDAGNPARFPGAPGPVGTVVVTAQVTGPQQYSLVLDDGVQTVSPVVAQVLQNAGGSPGAALPVVTPAALAKMAVVPGIDVSAYPSGPLQVVDTHAEPATCWWWQRTQGEPQARTEVVSGPNLPIPSDQTAKLVSLVKADTSGAEADQVFFGPGFANFVVVTGNDPAAATAESLWWVSESGVRFGVDRDREALTALGLTTAPRPAPWTVVRLLAAGPILSRADALVRHDTLPSDMTPGKLEIPK